MKVVQISSEVNIGSVGKIAEQIGERILERSGESYITYARDILPSKSKVLRIGNKLDIYNHVLQTRLVDNHCFASKQATIKLIDEIKEISPDVIHLHHLHGYFINIEILFNFLKQVKIPVVWTFHDCWAFTGHCTYFEYVNCEKWKIECFNCPQLNTYPKTLFVDRSKKNFLLKSQIFNGVENLTIVPVSNWLGNIVKESFLKKYPIKVIQNGVDTITFSPKLDSSEIKKRFNIYKDFIILGVASTWEPRKGLEYFHSLNNLIDNKSVIILVGLSKKQIKNLPNSIIGIERTENINDLASLYSAADVFVNPTLEDTFPTTNLEALSCGTPVITFKTGGSVESVSEETGLVVTKGNVDELNFAINIVKRNTKSFYTENCRKRAIKLYDKKARFLEYIELYDQVINK